MPANLHPKDFLVHNIQRKKRTRAFQKISLAFEIRGNDRVSAVLLTKGQRELGPNLAGSTDYKDFIHISSMQWKTSGLLAGGTADRYKT
jgi:hypothetical protein